MCFIQGVGKVTVFICTGWLVKKKIAVGNSCSAGGIYFITSFCTVTGHFGHKNFHNFWSIFHLSFFYVESNRSVSCLSLSVPSVFSNTWTSR